jgi:hypothetical protein
MTTIDEAYQASLLASRNRWRADAETPADLPTGLPPALAAALPPKAKAELSALMKDVWARNAFLNSQRRGSK